MFKKMFILVALLCVIFAVLCAQDYVTVFGTIQWAGGQCGNIQPYGSEFTVKLYAGATLVGAKYDVQAISGIVVPCNIPYDPTNPPDRAVVSIGNNSTPNTYDVTGQYLEIHAIIWMGPIIGGGTPYVNPTMPKIK